MPTLPNPHGKTLTEFLEWDESVLETEAREGYIENYMGDNPDTTISEDMEAVPLSFITEYITDAHDLLTEELTNWMAEVNPDGDWHAVAENRGWQKLSGYKDFSTDDGHLLLCEILPENTQVIFKMYHDGPNGLAVNIFTHDSPTGEWVFITPRTVSAEHS